MMWIRSQNKKYLIKAMGVFVDFNLVKCSIDTQIYIIGEYTNQKKALKVLDDIENTLYCLNGFYQMPEDDEVEDNE